VKILPNATQVSKQANNGVV